MDVIGQAEEVRDILQAAGVASASLDEIRTLVAREGSAASIAVVGPHSAGKTALIAALTGSARAREEVGAGPTTTKPVPYELTTSDGRLLTVWDTPGLGSEFGWHDELARDTITRADALLVAVDEELLSDEGRRALRQLVIEGRKLGATLYVITKADRSEGSELELVAEDLRDSLLPIPAREIQPTPVSAREYLDEPDADQLTRNIGLLRGEIVRFVAGAADERAHLTGAVRLLHLIEDTMPKLADEREPELATALRLHQRLRRLLSDGRRQMLRLVDTYSNELRLQTAIVGEVLADAYDLLEATDDSRETEWRTQLKNLYRIEEELSGRLRDDVAELMTTLADEADALKHSELAAALREELVSIGAPSVDTEDRHDAAGSFETPNEGWIAPAKGTLAALGVALEGFKGLGKVSPGLTVAAPALDLLAWHLKAQATQEHQARVAAAKKMLRARLDERAAKIAHGWRAQLDDTLQPTIGRATQHVKAIEDDLEHEVQQLTEGLSTLRKVRHELAAAVPPEWDHVPT